MRQVFFLLAAAMFVAFSLSWASPHQLIESHFAVPNYVSFPKQVAAFDRAAIMASVTLKDSCESIEKVTQEARGHKVIFSIRLNQPNNRICLQEARTHVPVDLAIEEMNLNSSRKIDIYFREDEENLRYFGSIELKEELISKY